MSQSPQEPRDSSVSWPSPPAQPTLGSSDVHIFLVSLEQSPALVDRLRQILTPDEQTRAGRFHFEVDHQHFIVARGCLRTILGSYLRLAPAALRFTYAENGKPQLIASVERSQPLKFSLSHSGSLALYAFTHIAEIGIDLERIRPEFASDDVAHRFFSETEFACLAKLPPPARHQAFFRCWTRKEAFIKAKGIGLSLPLDQFDVTLAPGELAALLRTRWDEDEAARWSLKDVDVGAGYTGAVAIERHNWELTCWKLKDADIVSLISTASRLLKN